VAINQPIDEAIVADGPAAYFSALPIKATLKALIAEACLPRYPIRQARSSAAT